jgi:SPP1 gp7 family putative phage head morphogenesis protein
MFGLPPEKVVEYMKSKGYAISWNWQEVREETHTKAFTVAKATTLDILQDIRKEVQNAIDNGITLQEFKKNLEPTLRKKGWWGKAIDGETGKTVQLGSPRRLKTIYETNLRTSYMTGKYKSLTDQKKFRPYWMYDAVDDSKTRPAHAALDGKVYSADDPVWNTIYPPNGWGCRCSVRALSEAKLKALGKTVESSDGKLVEVEKEISPGEKVTVTGIQYAPGKIMSPDAGWNYNVGKSAWSPDLNKYDSDLADGYIKQLVKSSVFDDFYNGQSGREWIEVGAVKDNLKEILEKEAKTKTGIVLLSKQTIDSHKHHKDIGLNQYKEIPGIINNPDAVIYDDDSRLFFYVKEVSKREVVVKITKNKNQLFVVSYHTGRIRKKGRKIYEKK